MFTKDAIHNKIAEEGVRKVNRPLLEQIVLGFAAGALIALGYMGYIHVVAEAQQFGSIATLFGASVFPVGLIAILIAGGELATGNMMTVSYSFYDKRISFADFARNILVISLANLVGAIFVAYFFGYLTGLTSTGALLEATNNAAMGKFDATFWQAFLSGIACNWLVGLAVWMSMAVENSTAKFLVIWFPIMAFVLIGFQHSVANMFVIPAAVFNGAATWSQFIENIIPVWLGNVVGGSVFVSYLYFIGYRSAHDKAPVEGSAEALTKDYFK